MRTDYYDALGIERSISFDELKKVLAEEKRKWLFRQSAPDPGKQLEAIERVQLIEEAEKEFESEETRRAYDESLISLREDAAAAGNIEPHARKGDGEALPVMQKNKIVSGISDVISSWHAVGSLIISCIPVLWMMFHRYWIMTILLAFCILGVFAAVDFFLDSPVLKSAVRMGASCVIGFLICYVRGMGHPIIAGVLAVMLFLILSPSAQSK